jgi:preprotein translocase subunit YajC
MNHLVALWTTALPVVAAAEKSAPPKRPQTMFPSLIFILVMFFILYFLMIRPQRKRQRERLDMLGALRKGDRVITRGGIHGLITLVRDHDVVLKVDDNVKLTVSKAGIARLVSPEGEGAEDNKS